MATVVEGKGQALDAVIKMVAEIVGDAVGEPFAEEEFAEAGDGAHEGDGQDDAAGNEEGTRNAGIHPPVNRVFDNLRYEQIQQRSREHSAIGQQHLFPVRAKIIEQAAVNAKSSGHKRLPPR